MHKRCPITYTLLPDAQKYSQEGLRLLSRSLKRLCDLPYTAQELRYEAGQYADKLSIQGVQYKLSARLNIKAATFECVEKRGTYILKPQSDVYAHLPENEDLSMHLAKTLSIDVPVHGLVYNKDETFTYFIKRFDRSGHNRKHSVEDFAQLSNHSRRTKYQFSMERLIPVIEQFCTFPQLDKKRLFERTIFNWVIGNEDMHLKNFALITRDRIIQMAPAFDFVNSTIVLRQAKEELALPLNGKKSNLSRKDLVEYFGQDRLALPSAICNEVIERLETVSKTWPDWIEHSFLPSGLKAAYHTLVEQRLRQLFE